MTTLQEYGKSFLEAVTGGRLKEAFAAIDGAYKLKGQLEGQIFGAPRRARGRPRTAEKAAAAGNGAAAAGKAESTRRRREKGQAGVADILRARGALTREQIITAMGWSAGTANLQLPRLVKAGEIALDAGLYHAVPPASAPAAAQETAAA